jgi:hypothetical protein
MYSQFKIHIDKQDNKKSRDYRLRVINTNYPNMRKALTRFFKTRKEAEQFELYSYKLLQFISEDK